ncbi:Esterase/lipase/thioesterase [Tulasnella sp. 418]|nr:Esterase/lipase/thioesterase [Tulasnella sp. 418]
MKYILTLFTLSTSLLSYVSAHGYVQSIEVEGKTYSGWIPFQDEYSSPAPARITRKIPNDGPVGDYTSNDIICNTGAPDKAGAQAPIDAGKEVTFKWNQVTCLSLIYFFHDY